MSPGSEFTAIHPTMFKRFSGWNGITRWKRSSVSPGSFIKQVARQELPARRVRRRRGRIGEAAAGWSVGSTGISQKSCFR